MPSPHRTGCPVPARLESTYRQSLSALAEDLEGIETDLTKSVYANGAATLSDVSRDLSQQANQAKDSLSRLRWSR